MRSRSRVLLLAVLLIAGLVAAGCGSSDDSSDSTTTTKAASGSPTAGKPRACADITEQIGLVLGAEKAKLEDKVKNTTKLAALFKESAARAPVSIKAAMTTNQEYYDKVVAAVAGAKDVADFEAKAKTVSKDESTKASKTTETWFSKNCT